MTSIFGTLRRNKKPSTDSAQGANIAAKPPSNSKSRNRRQTLDIQIEDVDDSELPNINSQFKRTLSLSKSGRCKSHSKQPANRKSILTTDELYKQPSNSLENNSSSPSLATRQQQQQQNEYQKQPKQSQQGAKWSPSINHSGAVKAQTYEYNLPPSVVRTGQSTAL